jgi:aldehyde:ferredoxin oxidoreductase
MRGGTMNQLLFVDLDDGTTHSETPGVELYDLFLGGYGLGAKILLTRQPGGVDPLGPENHLGLVSGPLVGSRTYNAGRFTIVGKSPLTGGWGDSSCGGHFSRALKGSGYDAVFFRGVSRRPVYAFLSPDGLKLLDASDLWGQDTFETERRLTERHGSKAQVLCIGLAGENQNRIAGIVHEYGRMAARCGLGAVMGAKRLKAIVATGDLPVPVADEEAERELVRRYRDEMRDNVMVDAFRRAGTTGGLAKQIEMGDTPIKNWNGVPDLDFPWAEEVSGAQIGEREIKKYGCYRCGLACGAWLSTPNAKDEETLTRKPEYETVAAFGPLLLIHDLDTIIVANEYCDRVGMDTISAGAAIALAMECVEKGLLTQEDTGGLDLTWGNADVLLPLLEQMARREGFGAILADGPESAARQIGQGAEAFAIHIGGEAVPMHDPRLRPGWATSYQVDATPAHHEQGGAHFGEGAWGLPGFDTPKFDPYEYSGKSEFQYHMSTLVHVVNSAGLCKFIVHCLPVAFLPEFLNAVVGTNYRLEDLYALGERIAAVRQMFNVREGITLRDMRMPDRLRGKPPLTKGPLQSITIDDDTQIKEYLDLLDWDQVTGKPSPERLRTLGLEDLIANA